MRARWVTRAVIASLVLSTTQTAFAFVPIPLVEPLCLLNPGAYTCGGRKSISQLLAPSCPSDRWVGLMLLGLGTCPAPGTSSQGTWSVSKLFPALPGVLPGQLERFCIYEWTPAIGTNNAPLTNLLPNLLSLRLERDCQVVAPLALPSEDTAAILQSSYDQQINRPVFPAGTQVPPKVRVAVVDTSPDEETSGLPSGDIESHGLAIGSLIRHNSCFVDANGQELGCGAFVTSHQALGPETGDRPSFGFQSEVARAIVRAVRSFQEDGAQDRLIINLSLGWDSTFGGLYGVQIRIPSLAVWLAIQYAVCEGALVIAAAGNGSSVEGPTGPMVPALFEAEKRLCTGLLSYDPPVFAVGGVDGADQPIGNGRPDGHSRLVAPASFVVSERIDPATGAVLGPTPVLSGTSLSAAGVSGVAAMAWSLRPDLNAIQLMQLLSDAGPSLGEYADFNSPPFLTTKHRLDACATIEAINPPVGSAPLPCTSRPAGTDVSPDISDLLDSEWPGLRTGAATPGCSATTMFSVLSAKNATAEPNAVPLPGSPTCSLCGFSAASFYGQVNLGGMSLQQVILYPKPCSAPWCDPGTGGVKITISNPDAPFKVDVPGFVGQLDSAVVEVRASVQGETIVEMSPVAIDN